MASLAFLILAFAPIAAPLVVLGAGAVLFRRVTSRPPVKGRRLPSGTTCTLVAVMAGAAALGAYASGVMSGFYILDPDQMCASRGAQGDHVVTRATLPVSSQCVTSDGVGTELVPGWVNPVVFVGLTLFVLAVATGILGLVRRFGARA
ncbi:hypothetical protein LXH13_01185 [Streptomyces spinosirectus]|jgi:hypothetical protein|uniref:hypothetical protein n=1 Tax=Streptomyces TaxID=1883 RepID=UPI000D3A13CD|nr:MULTISPECIES: hypothetical protein [Streptomyces]MBY8339644.1 hypothetical protein [Streptomyces plumbidurans]PTM87085.1 hypothetical protein C7821_116118 [Streptomyces sp. VMFN-G11Ma]UIR15719.1 hypothetical protein LXH13_01185 [Streptomyces spinosirectus]